MDSTSTGWGAVLLTLISTVGAGVVGLLHWRKARDEAREARQVASFEAISRWMAEDRERLAADRDRQAQRIADLEARAQEQEERQRLTMAYLRTLLEDVRRAGAEPSTPPPGLDLT
ncbi:hypothetical protein [Streptomyces bohaiensis]|uniref:Uncharacterized protein n=1 Tax=Streptomyces bohaiensis TaxID=1431344 RepID=A0ABX1C4U3_9ACTN|nr:hypothetical protein [Streptomyces bohaiensis]NJQ14235.1 hypothetical protein [Streptomyces bohaiensis]